MVKDLTWFEILGMSFLNMLYSVHSLDKAGIGSIVKGYRVKFEFIKELKTRFIDKI